MELAEEVDGGTVTLRLHGDLDMATAETLEQAVVARLASPDVATAGLSLAGLTFTDSSGLTTLVAIQEAAEREGVALVLTGVSRQVRRLMDITSMTATFDIR